MTKYIIRRLLQAIPVVFLISVVCFFLMLLAPGGPQAQFNQNRFVTQAQVTAWLQHWCLSRNPSPIDMLKEYGGWLGVWNCQAGSLLSAHGLPNFLPAFLGGGDNGMLHGDWGISIYLNQPVLTVILGRLPVTLLLMTTAWIIWLTLALLLGRDRRGQAVQPLRPGGDPAQLHVLFAANLLVGPDAHIPVRGQPPLVPNASSSNRRGYRRDHLLHRSGGRPSGRTRVCMAGMWRCTWCCPSRRWSP